MEKLMYERNLELYRLQLNRTTNEDIRRQLLRLIAEEKQHLPRRADCTQFFIWPSRRLWRSRGAKNVEQQPPDPYSGRLTERGWSAKSTPKSELCTSRWPL